MPCETITIPESDGSELVILDTAFVPKAPRTIDVAVELTNNIISGDGESISRTLEITANGEQVVNEQLAPIQPGITQTFEAELSNLPTGTVEMCANLV